MSRYDFNRLLDKIIYSFSQYQLSRLQTQLDMRLRLLLYEARLILRVERGKSLRIGQRFFGNHNPSNEAKNDRVSKRLHVGFDHAYFLCSTRKTHLQRLRRFALSFPVLMTCTCLGQTNTATTFLTQVTARHPSMALLQSVRLDGSAQWTAGSLHESGPVSFEAAADGSSSLTFSLGKASRSETRSALTSRKCQWTDSKGKTNPLVSPDCFAPVPWYAPTLLIQPSLDVSSQLNISDDGLVTKAGSTYRQVSYATNLHGMDAPSAKFLSDCTRVSILYDTSTMLPNSMEFDEHATTNFNQSAHVRVVYGNYQSVSGVQLPYLIERYVNNTLQLSIVLNNVVVQ